MLSHTVLPPFFLMQSLTKLPPVGGLLYQGTWLHLDGVRVGLAAMGRMF